MFKVVKMSKLNNFLEIDSKFLLIIVVVCVSSFLYLTPVNNGFFVFDSDNQSGEVVLQQYIFSDKIFLLSMSNEDLITERVIISDESISLSSNVYDPLINSEYDSIFSQEEDKKNQEDQENQEGLELKNNGVSIPTLDLKNEKTVDKNRFEDDTDENEDNKGKIINKDIVFNSEPSAKFIDDQTKQKVHEIYLTDEGFVPSELNINVGDKVVWIQQRDKFNVGTIYGTGKFIGIKSKFLKRADTFGHTFEMGGDMTYVDIISKHQVGKLFIE